jgi:asparagine synthase (glutamine-hydrolysing)
VCGIAGYTHSTRRADAGLIRRITGRLRHRGPDQEGVYISDGVSLGAVRLRIIDLEDGEQPMTSDDGQTVLVYNGEIYNYQELRETLTARGHRFRSSSDTEVLLRAFLEWDTACFEKLKGMFGLAIWEEGRRRLILARDRMGIKPVYFCRRGGQIYFGSELKAILEHAEISRNLDLAALDQYLSLNYVPWPRTLIQGIEKLPPGHVLEWSAGNIQLWPFWELRFGPQEHLTDDEAAERLDHLLRVSVRQHLVSDVPLGVLLSGGLDSSTMVHYAAEESAKHLKTFSISFAGRSFDETPYFRAVSERYGTEHYELDLARDLDLQETIRQFACYADEPCGDSSSLPVWYLSQLCRRHVTVALSGEGADELFGGYLTYQADRLARLARMVPGAVRRVLLAGAHKYLSVSEDKVSLEYMVKRFLEGTFLPPLEAHCYWNGTFSEEQKRLLCTYTPEAERSLAELARDAPAHGSLNRFLWFDQRYYLPDDILAKVDRMSMAHALEVRPPFLDHEIVEFAACLPERLKIRGRRQKYVLRHLMRDKLPPQVLERKKVGFDIPAHDWLRRELKPLLLDVLNPTALARTGLFRADAVGKLMNDHFDGRVNIGFHLWGLMILLLWMEKWEVRPSSQQIEEPGALALMRAARS